MHTADPESRRWLGALLALATVALFLLLHPYRGIVHDGHLYTLQALNALSPELYGNDVFLRHGSQDDFTLFSPLYAGAIAMLGLEPAAAVLTLAFILLFLVAAVLLARTVVPASHAWAVPLLLLLLPAQYGPGQIFHFIEEFITPRQLSEALALFAIVAWIRGARVVGAMLCVASMLVHPIIGLAGAVFIVAFALGWSNLARLWPVAVAALAVAVAAAAGLVPLGRWQFDPQWGEIAMSRLYLSLANWDLQDWGRIATVFASLAVSALMLADLGRRVAVAAMIACGGLLLLALIGGDVLELVLVVQAQPWRGLWLATVLSLVLLPATWSAGWQRGGLSRCALLVLAAAWAAPDTAYSLGLAPLAVAATLARGRPEVESRARLLVAGAWLVLLGILLYAVADGLLAFRGGLTRMEELPPVLDRVVTFSLGGVPPALALAACYALVRWLPSIAPRALCAAGIAVVATLAFTSGPTWAMARFPESLRESFAPWRALIPPGSDVLWIGQSSDREDTAFYTWLLLERPSFISRNQASNALFSRPAALEMYQRARMLDGILPFWDPFSADLPEVPRPLRLAPACRHTPVRYVVSSEPLVDAEGIPPARDRGEFAQYKLYICP